MRLNSFCYKTKQYTNLAGSVNTKNITGLVELYVRLLKIKKRPSIMDNLGTTPQCPTSGVSTDL